MSTGDEGLLSPAGAGSPVEPATGDVAFLQAMLDAEAALTRAWGAPPGVAAAVADAARAGRFDVRDLALRSLAAGNPVVVLVEELRAAVGATAAPYVHRGATSQDILDSALMLMAARALPLISAELSRAAGSLTELAALHRDTVLPGRTLTQHAVPTTLGLKAAGWRSLVLDAHDRLTALRPPAQLGGAAGTMAAFAAYAAADSSVPTDPPPGGSPPEGPLRGADDAPAADPGLTLIGAFARELGLAEPPLPWHTLRTPVADLGFALAFTCGALGKLAADVLVLSRTEIGEAAEGNGGTSSAMPHKANPVRSALITAAARQAPGLAAVLLSSLTAEDERPAGAWHAEWGPLRELLRLAGGAARHAADLTADIRVFPRKMREHLDLGEGLIVSERVSAAIGRDRTRELMRLAEEQGTGFSGAVRAAGYGGLLDPADYTGSAGVLVDRALRRAAWPDGTDPTP